MLPLLPHHSNLKKPKKSLTLGHEAYLPLPLMNKDAPCVTSWGLGYTKLVKIKQTESKFVVLLETIFIYQDKTYTCKHFEPIKVRSHSKSSFKEFIIIIIVIIIVMQHFQKSTISRKEKEKKTLC